MAETTIKQRLAAILAADVAGYSRLMSADERATRAAEAEGLAQGALDDLGADDERATLTALDIARGIFREQIENHQGRVIDMAGDSVLAVFDTATGAVAAALAVQKNLSVITAAVSEDRQMHFRIGVHLGDVMEKTDGTIYGDGVNIAARLQTLASAGGVCLSGVAHDQVKIEFRISRPGIGESRQ